MLGIVVELAGRAQRLVRRMRALAMSLVTTIHRYVLNFIPKYFLNRLGSF
jgi:hypothetical protein